MASYDRGSPETRLWSQVGERQDGGCWEWTGCLNKPGGYGRIAVGGKQVMAHRYSYELLVGPVPDGLELDHLCRNRRCVNPDHLEPVTHAENVNRGDLRLVELSKTHCPQGHPYSGENLYVSPRGSRYCRLCTAASGRRYLARKRLK